MKCTLGVFPALAFVADFLPVAHKFHQCTHRVRLRNSGIAEKNRHRKITGAHLTAVILPHFREYSTKKNRLQYRTKFILKIE